MRVHVRLACALCAAGCASTGALADQAQPLPESLKRLSLEELMDVDVSTASRIPGPRFETPAAVYIITRDELRRSGARSIPEALRLVPGVEVARGSAHSWNISLRGFNGELSNKLLVLIDGRSVYSPLFGGVFWDAQDYLVDIERIEVVGGPGGTLWGTNAVNGVINIITRSADAAPGALVQLGGGDEERAFGAARVSGPMGPDWHGRGYVKYSERDASQSVSGLPAIDDWRMASAGFRFDRDEDTDSFTVHGDVYDGEEGARLSRDFMLGTLPSGSFVTDSELRGANLLGRWSRRQQPGAELALQFYYDRTEREIPSTFTEARDTFDVDFQHRLPRAGRHEFLWGAGVRLSKDSIDNSTFATFDPAGRSDTTYSGFVQDKIDLWQERLFLTFGSKLEHNDYSGAEFQPNVRLAGLVSDSQMVWAAVSRAVRIPSRLDSDLQLTAPLSIPGIPVPLYVRVNGSEDFEPEELLAYEAGWRAELGSSVSLDLSAYHHDYQDLQTQEPLTPVFVPGPLPYILLPNVLVNGKDADARGANVAITWQPSSVWRVQLHYSWLDLEVDPHPGSLDQSARNNEGNSPEHQAGMHAYLDLARDVSLYGGLRYVDELPVQSVPAYLALDANLVWRVSRDFELALTGRNLLDPAHPEFAGNANEIERNWYARVTWRY